VTADELWRHLPGDRETSVHVGLFPRSRDIERLAEYRARVTLGEARLAA
jgi:hypothetical protein